MLPVNLPERIDGVAKQCTTPWSCWGFDPNYVLNRGYPINEARASWHGTGVDHQSTGKVLETDW